MLNEWNMSLRYPPLDPRFQPCFVADVAWQMMDAGLDYSCYYHIRDWHVSTETFARFMSPAGTALMTRWWNRMPQFDGLFDYQNRLRPTYFTFKLLSRLAGERLRLESSDAAVHGFATHDPMLQSYNVMLWNFSQSPVRASVTVEGGSEKLTARRVLLDAVAPTDDENIRLKPLGPLAVSEGTTQLSADLDPYGITFWTLERR